MNLDTLDTFDLAQALYWHCADYHEGQWSDRYRILSTLHYRPGAMERGPSPDSEAAMLYDALADGSVTPDTVLAALTLRLEEE